MINNLINEIKNGNPKREQPFNSSLDFSGKIQAEYFSNLRRFLQSTTSETVFNVAKNTADIVLLKRIKDIL